MKVWATQGGLQSETPSSLKIIDIWAQIWHYTNRSFAFVMHYLFLWPFRTQKWKPLSQHIRQFWHKTAHARQSNLLANKVEWKEDKIITLWALLEPWATKGLHTENGKIVNWQNFQAFIDCNPPNGNLTPAVFNLLMFSCTLLEVNST